MSMSGQSANKPVIGIVGGVGSGKSTVAGQLARLGCLRIDADRIGHDMLGKPDVRAEIRSRWGAAVFDDHGRVSRPALADAVFSDAGELAALNAILHPRIRRVAEQRIAEARGRPAVPAVVLDAALLLEAGWNDLCTHLVFVDCPAEQRLERVGQNRGWDEATWRRRESLQIFLDTKARMCDYTVENSSSVPHLVQQTRKLLTRIVAASDCP